MPTNLLASYLFWIVVADLHIVGLVWLILHLGGKAHAAAILAPDSQRKATEAIIEQLGDASKTHAEASLKGLEIVGNLYAGHQQVILALSNVVSRDYFQPGLEFVRRAGQLNQPPAASPPGPALEAMAQAMGLSPSEVPDIRPTIPPLEIH